MLNKGQVLAALTNASGVPHFGKNVGRTIYEIAGPRGHFQIDYATYPGGVTEEVPRSVIDELEQEGKIWRAFPNTSINAWKLVS